jgi:hypothetical protein
MDEGFVTVTPVGDRSADVRICSPDATGFGCDLARTMFDFGLVVERGDFSTDGKWSFLMFKVRALVRAARARDGMPRFAGSCARDATPHATKRAA